MTPDGSTSAVITGCGAISPAGISRGHAHCPALDAGSQEAFDPVRFLGKKGLRDLDRSSQLLLSAAAIALDDARLVITDDNRHEVGVSVGTTFGSLHSISLFDRSSIVDGPRYVNPSLFPNTVVNAPAGRLAIRFGTRGFNATISTGFCAGLDALCHAVDQLRASRAVAVLVGSVEDMSEEALHYFRALGPRGTASIADEPRCSESGVVLVLEQEESARKRDAPILGRVLGYGKATGPAGSHGTGHSESAGLIDALNAALSDAALTTSEIGAVYVAALADASLQSRAADPIAHFFGSASRNPAIHSINALFGETYSASGLHAVASAIRESSHENSAELSLVLTSDPLGSATSVIVGRFS